MKFPSLTKKQKQFSLLILILGLVVFSAKFAGLYSIYGVDTPAQVTKSPFTFIQNPDVPAGYFRPNQGFDWNTKIWDGCQLDYVPATDGYNPTYGCKDNVFYQCNLNTYATDYDHAPYPSITFVFQDTRQCTVSQDCVVSSEFKGCKEKEIIPPQPECIVDNDCTIKNTGKIAPACVGGWKCGTQQTCSYVCDSTPIEPPTGIRGLFINFFTWLTSFFKNLGM